MLQYSRWFPPSGTQCARHGRSGRLTHGGFTGKNAGFVHTVEDGYYLYRSRYYCRNRNEVGAKCSGEANSDIDLITPMYPPAVRGLFPFLGTYQARFDRSVLAMPRRYMSTPEGNATAFRNAMAGDRADYWARRGLQYY